MRKAAVIGDPIGHSLSPEIFSQLCLLAGVKDFSYEAVQVPSIELPLFFEKSKKGLIGFNVTIPHKESIMAFLNKVSPSAQGVGAVNVVSFSGDGRSEGFNTDVDGFTECLIENKINLTKKRALILGAGGAARAVAFSLGRLGCAGVTLLNKTLLRAQKLADAMTPHFPQTPFDAVSHSGEIKNRNSVDLIVNSTPIGMEGIPFTNESRDFLREIAATVANNKTVFFDLIYRPQETAFLSLGRELGSPLIGGLPMLINQAVATWEIWMGRLKNKDLVKTQLTEFLQKKLGGAENLKVIFLTGFMGSGKSTVGEILARELGRVFFDTDELIEEKAGKPVSEIFASLGEPEFRKIEKQVIQDLIANPSRVPMIVALGGGALTLAENLDLVLGAGSLIYLSATTETLVSRLEGTEEVRPLLKRQGGNLSSIVSQMLQLRKPQYEKSSLVIQTDGLEPHEVASKAQAALKGQGLS